MIIGTVNSNQNNKSIKKHRNEIDNLKNTSTFYFLLTHYIIENSTMSDDTKPTTEGGDSSVAALAVVHGLIGSNPEV